jgi:outer membrane protein OmpA-like peptidoglycan-associated protein
VQAERTDLYVVLPDKAGKAGTVIVQHGETQHELHGSYASARMSVAGGLETGTASEQEVRDVFAAALAAQPPRPLSFTLFFLEDTDEFTPESKQVVDAIFAEIARRPAVDVVVIGHTDRLGTPAYNDTLSVRRAQRVRADLVRLGIPGDRIEAAGRGEREPLVPTGPGVREPRNRRAEITVR